MKNKERVKLLFRAVLMDASSGIVVNVGVLELVTLILLFCGMLHLTRGLEERGDENQDGVENNKVELRWRQGEVERKRETMATWRGGREKGELADWRHDQEDRGQPWHKEGRSEVGSRDCVTVLSEEDQAKREELQTTGVVQRSGIDEARSGKFYAVRRGRQTGIFTSWEDCRLQVEGYS